MTIANGVHHLAICTQDMKKQIEYFADVLGARLVALYWMHGTEGAWHGFMEITPECSIAFVQMPGTEVAPVQDVSHARHYGTPSAGGTMQHLALNVANRDDLLALRDRIRSRGIVVMGPLDHGFCVSIYFAGLEGLNLEISTSAEPINSDAWIDPEVVGLADISAEELARYRAPADYSADVLGSIPQPDVDSSKPQIGYPEGLLRKLVKISDEEMFRTQSDPEPPVAL